MPAADVFAVTGDFIHAAFSCRRRRALMLCHAAAHFHRHSSFYQPPADCRHARRLYSYFFFAYIAATSPLLCCAMRDSCAAITARRLSPRLPPPIFRHDALRAPLFFQDAAFIAVAFSRFLRYIIPALCSERRSAQRRRGARRKRAQCAAAVARVMRWSRLFSSAMLPPYALPCVLCA